MRRLFPRPDDDERRRHESASGGHRRGAHGYDRAGSNDPDREPPGGPWGPRERRDVRADQPYDGAYGQPRWRRDAWDEDRYGYPEATSYAREMQRGRDAYESEGRFARYDEPWRGGSVDWQRGEPPDAGQNRAPDASSGYGYGRQQRDEWSDAPRRDIDRDDGRAYGRLGGSFGARESLPAGPAQDRRWRAERGPKNYTRSDERIRDDVCERLYQEPGIDVREVSVQVVNGTVVLEGTVPERGMKHHIEDVCEQCIGVHDIDDRIRVERVGDGLRRAARQNADGDTAGGAREATGHAAERENERGGPSHH